MSKFKVGDYWRSNNGEKWRILATDGPKHSPIIALNEEGRVISVNNDGMYLVFREDEFDLIEPWVEPKAKLIAWIAKDTSKLTDYTWWYVRFTNADFRFPDDSGYIRAPWLDMPESNND